MILNVDAPMFAGLVGWVDPEKYTDAGMGAGV
jgi:hypothetical protein